MKILNGHTSPETAYVVADYPYGFRLRCQIRYWVETTKHGQRFVSQTSNPKKPGLIWNKPKASTYAKVCVMYLNDDGHVHLQRLNEYAGEEEIATFRRIFADGLSPEQLKIVDDFAILAKRLAECVAEYHRRHSA